MEAKRDLPVGGMMGEVFPAPPLPTLCDKRREREAWEEDDGRARGHADRMSPPLHFPSLACEAKGRERETFVAVVGRD